MARPWRARGVPVREARHGNHGERRWAGAFGVMKLTLTSHGYSWDHKPTLPGPGFDSTALRYSDSGSGTCG